MNTGARRFYVKVVGTAFTVSPVKLYKATKVPASNRPGFKPTLHARRKSRSPSKKFNKKRDKKSPQDAKKHTFLARRSRSYLLGKSSAGNALASFHPSSQPQELARSASILKNIHDPTPKNANYDEGWAAKQERAFTRWLNYVLVPLVPEKTTLSMADHRRLYEQRRAARCLFQSSQLTQLLAKVDYEIEAGHIAVRPDRHPRMDVGMRDMLLDTIMCVHPAWLRLALETITGLAQDHTQLATVDIAQQTLRKFVADNILFDHKLASEFKHPTVPEMYRPGFEDAIKKHFLRMFLRLVYILDQAKLQQLLPRNTCLFIPGCHVKTSKDMLTSLCKDVLQGEGDFVKHLGLLGYTVSHEQQPLDEVDYEIKTLAVDLRDGVRLARYFLWSS